MTSEQIVFKKGRIENPCCGSLFSQIYKRYSFKLIFQIKFWEPTEPILQQMNVQNQQTAGQTNPINKPKTSGHGLEPIFVKGFQ